jgi:short-subunit dehydrogenase
MEDCADMARVAVGTGGSSGIGAEIARRLVYTVNAGFVETEGFPQRSTLPHGLLERVIIEPDAVARVVLRMLDRDRRETFIPWWFRPLAVLQALFPALVARVLARGGGKGIRVEDGS